ncbi:MAG: ABC transporter substrate-binding protein [Cyanobacteriota bacterium]|nr:ABC transporter substrate-binding protein [Cyanobacteriota bacterium]
MRRRSFGSLAVTVLSACLVILLSTYLPLQAQSLKNLTISEPARNLGYLPLYVAVREGYFRQAGLNVEILTAAGGGHVSTVISDDAWGFIGGPESAAFANQKGQNMKTIVNVVNKANVYMVAKPDLQLPEDPSQMADFMKGKVVVGGRFGGSPNLLARYYITSLGLDPDKDVEMVELADSGTVLAQFSQQGDISYTTEPQITQGIQQGLWGEPFYSFPAELGDYAYSTINVKESTYTQDPETAQAFVDALLKGIKFVNDNPEAAFEIAQQEFTSIKPELIKAALDRAYADQLWTLDGTVSEQALTNAMEIPIASGLYKGSYSYDALVDMQFIKGS